jgi:predicted O-methyltransferase YrrM
MSVVAKFQRIARLSIKGLRNPRRGHRYLLDVFGHPHLSRIVDSVEGWISLRTAIVLFDAVISNGCHPGDVIEVGAFKGLSTCVLSLAAKRVGKRVKSFELFSGLPQADPILDADFKPGMFTASVEEYEKNVRAFGRRECVDLIVGDARQNLKTVGSNGFSVAFVDTDTYEVTRDVLLQLSTLAKGGEIVIIHDYYAPGVAKAIEHFKQATPFDLVTENVEKADLTVQYRIVPRQS